MTPQVAPVQYWIPGGPFGVGDGSGENADLALKDEGGWGFRSTSMPVSAFSSGLRFGGGSFGTLSLDGAQYGYTFKGLGDTPVRLFGGVQSLRSTGDTIGALINPGLTADRTLATSIHAGVEFKPTSNLSLSLSGSFVQPTGGVADRTLRPTYLPGERPFFDGDQR